MVRHIEFTINFDLTCWAEGKEDFGFDEDEIPKDNEFDYDEVKECIYDYIESSPEELYAVMQIKKVWYEEDEE
jgi:hypothetical protein